MNKMILAVCLMVLAAAGCGADTTAQCHQEADCSNVSKDLTCVTLTAGKSIAGENGKVITEGSWCAQRPTSCSDALKAFCAATGEVCVEENEGAGCRNSDGTKTGCAAKSCAAGESCVEVAGQGLCVKTCNQDAPDCPNEKFCGAHPIATMIKVCLPDLANDKSCDRPAMCLSNNCPAVADPTKRVCAAVTNPQCTGDDINQGCNVASEFCDPSAMCSAKRDGGQTCQKDTWCKSANCVKQDGKPEGVCSDYHPTNCASNSIVISGPADLKCYGLVGQKKGELLVTSGGVQIPAPTGTWDVSGNFAHNGTTVKYCLSDWAPHFNCCTGPDCGTAGPNQKWLVGISKNGMGQYDPSTLVVDTTVVSLPPNTCRAVKSSTGGNMLCDLK